MTDQTFTISDSQRDYSTFGLEENPFPYSPVPSEDPEIYCGQDHVTEAVSNTVSTVLSTGKSKHLVITGKYGNGKSHTLKYTRSLVRDRDDVLVGYVAQPGDGFLDIYHEFMYDVGFDQVEDLAYEYFGRIARDVTDANPADADEMRTLVDEGEVLLSDVVPTAIKRLSETTRFADFARAIAHMVYENTNLYAWQWLTAEGIRYEQRKEMEIHTALDDDTMGVRAFTSFRDLLLELGYTAVFVFVDEFESIARLSPKDEQATLNSIRHLMDQNSHGLCMLFGCAPEVWQDVMGEYHAFSERIGNEIALHPLSEDQLEALVTKYMDLASEERPVDLSPFSQDSIRLMLEMSQGNVRQALTICSRSVDHAIDQGKNQIDIETIESIV